MPDRKCCTTTKLGKEYCLSIVGFLPYCPQNPEDAKEKNIQSEITRLVCKSKAKFLKTGPCIFSSTVTY